MRKTFLLLIFLASSFAHAEPDTQMRPPAGLVEASLVGSYQAAEKYDDMGTKFIVYSLIVSVYALYWFKRKA